MLKLLRLVRLRPLKKMYLTIHLRDRKYWMIWLKVNIKMLNLEFPYMAILRMNGISSLLGQLIMICFVTMFAG